MAQSKRSPQKKIKSTFEEVNYRARGQAREGDREMRRDEMGRGGSIDTYHSLVRFMEKLEREDLLPVTMSRECRRAGSGLLFDNGADAMSARVLANQSTFAPFAYSFPLPFFVDSCHPSFLRFLLVSSDDGSCLKVLLPPQHH